MTKKTLKASKAAKQDDAQRKHPTGTSATPSVPAQTKQVSQAEEAKQRIEVTTMDKARVEFRGDAGTPVRYEDIVLWRDVVFLEWDCHYDEEVQSMGAPAVGTFNYTGYLREREGNHFGMTYFSLIVADGHSRSPTAREFWQKGESIIRA